MWVFHSRYFVAAVLTDRLETNWLDAASGILGQTQCEAILPR
jgi:hypothetical protein